MPIPTHRFASVNFHLDRIDMGLRCSPDSQAQLFKMLAQAGFRRTRHSYVKGGNYCCIDNMFSVGFGVALVIHSQRRSPVFRPLRLAIHDSTPDSIEFLLGIFDLLGITSKLSLVEFAFDIIPATGVNPYMIEQEIISRLSLIYQHTSKPAGSYRDLTFYTTNVRTAAKGHRVYQKTVEGRRVVRLELVMHRDPIKRIGLSLHNVMSTKPQALRKYVQFKFVDFDYLARYLIRKAGYVGGKPVSTGTNRPHVTQLVRSFWRSYLSRDMGDVFMCQRQRLKNEFENYHQFFKHDASLEQEFWDAVDPTF